MGTRFRPPQRTTTDAFHQQVIRLWPDTSEMRIAPLGFGLPFLFGDGSDGNTTISADTQYATGTIKQWKNFTLDATKTITLSDSTYGLLVMLASERMQINGTITLTGMGYPCAPASSSADDATSSYGGSGGGGGGANSGGGGGDGGSSVNAGGTGAAGAGGTGGAGIATTNLQKAHFRMNPSIRDGVVTSYGLGGGGGRSIAGETGGAGGDGGGVLILMAEEVTLGSASVLSCNGAAGDAGTAGGGGGGGGGGGVIYIVTRRFVNNGTGNVTVTGGAAGAGGGGGGAGGAGGAGLYVQETIPK